MDSLPRVTEILTDLGLLGPFPEGIPAIEKARRRGSAVHAAIHFWAENDLDPTSIHPEVFPFFKAAESWLRQVGGGKLEAEIELASPDLGYQGHLDAVLETDDGMVLIDWKTGSKVDLGPARLQIGGYSMLYRVLRGTPLVARYVVHLRPDGSHKAHEIPAEAAEPDWAACLRVWELIRQRKDGGVR